MCKFFQFDKTLVCPASDILQVQEQARGVNGNTFNVQFPVQLPESSSLIGALDSHFTLVEVAVIDPAPLTKLYVALVKGQGVAVSHAKDSDLVRDDLLLHFTLVLNVYVTPVLLYGISLAYTASGGTATGVNFIKQSSLAIAFVLI